MASALSLSVLKGDDLTRSFTIKDENDNPIDITGWTFLAQLRVRPSDAAVVETWTVTITNAAGGAFDMKLTAAKTGAMTPGTYVWDLQRTDAAGDILTLLAGSTLQVVQDVSRP